MATKPTTTLRVLALALALLFGISGTVGIPALGPATASAQEAQEAQTPDVDTDDDDAFDDWGLLGLLGLAGLAGLLRKPRPVVVDDTSTYRSR